MIKYIAAFFFSVGGFLIACDIWKIPLNKTIKSVMGLERQMYEGQSSRINTGLEEVAIWLAKVIKIDDYKRSQMVKDLNTAGLDISPEMFKANAIVKSGIIGVIAIPIFPLMWWLSLIIIVMAIILYFNNMRSLGGRIRAKREAIEFELPRLVFSIEKGLRHSRDILSMLEDFAETAGPELRSELAITTSDMRSGNYETAITRMEARVGSSMMSDVCRGLISIMRGDDTTVYWQSLELKFQDHQRELLKIQAAKIPKKVNKLSMTMLIFFMVVWVVVIGVELIDSLGMIFGSGLL
jgi:Flp pilus assembly protein TadB